MTQYYRIMLGKKSAYAEECFKGNFIGADFLGDKDLTHHIPDDWRTFNKEFIPIYLKGHPDKSKITAGLACGALWTIAKGLDKGDFVLCPNGKGSYLCGEITEAYSYHPNKTLPHRRTVKWFPQVIERSAMSQNLRNSTGSIGTTSDVTKFAEEILRLIEGVALPSITSSDETIENPSEFALEEHLEHFLVENWNQIELSKKYDILEEDGELVGKQFRIDRGRIDILAISKDRKELLVVELKKGRASDNVVGQVQRYMGYVLEELAEKNQTVKGIIIAMEDDQNIRRALSVTTNIEFYRYQVSFKLMKA